jgi:SAM-dependent methyltransferase
MRDDTLNDLRCALAVYCFTTQYIFDYPDAVKARAAALQTRLETLPPAAITNEARSFATLAMFVPLCRLRAAEAIEAALKNRAPLLDELLLRQIGEPLAEARLAAAIEAITPVADETSQAVRGQYEDFPYPRWRMLGPPSSYASIVGDEGAIEKILVAGCGTGLEACDMAAAFPNAAVLAIDLSRASLAYATRRASELGLKNVVFRQADILELGVLNESFDIVSSSGVLHHLRDPLAGWAVLAKLVRPGGFMRIALYSRLARRDFIKAQDMIRRDFGIDADSIRAFRARAPRLMKRKIFTRISVPRDYYSMSECRDFLFHVMENRFDIPGIAAALDRFGLTFLGFRLSAALRDLYRKENPADPALTDLSNWAAFEQKHPDSFAEMYIFWCRKNV